MEKRLLAAIVLSIVVLIGFNLLFQKKAPPKPPQGETQQTVTTQPGPKPLPVQPGAEEMPVSEQTPPEATETPRQFTPESSPPADDELFEVTEAPPRTVTVENDFYTAILDNRGGVLKNYILKKYTEDESDPFDLVPQNLPAGYGAFLSIVLPDNPEIEEAINSVHYEVDESSASSDIGRIKRIRFRYQRKDLIVEKVISFLLDRKYQMQITCSVTADGRPLNPFLRLGPGLTNHSLVPSEQNMLPPHIIYYDGNSDDTLMGEDVADEQPGQKPIAGPLRWVGVQTKFFAAIAIPISPFPQATVINKVWTKPISVPSEEEPQMGHIVSLLLPAPPESPITLYLGPKSYKILSSMGLQLTKIIDYGWFSFLVKPLYYALLFVNNYIPNWGWSIIVLTFFITLAVFPLRYMQMRSMKKMQKLQPQIKAIQAKYKGQKSADNRQKMNQEVMALYKEHGVNPMGGCLPLLIQFPFLIAFYRMIELSIEFWHQPWIFWLKDLSAKDPYYVTPILMGATMIIQMKQTPATPGQDNKMQKQMMYMMPIVFTFIFLNLSSGVVLYFLFSNLFSWGLQKLVENVIPGFSKKVNAKKTGKKTVQKKKTKR